MWSNDKLLHNIDMEQFFIAPHDQIAPFDKQFIYVVQNCLSYGAKLLHRQYRRRLGQILYHLLL